jgi:hypothetical protein
MTRQRLGGWLLVMLACAGALPLAAWACNVPVFRYALENWQPDRYQVLVLSRGPLNETQQQWFQRLEAASVDPQQPANLQVHAIDVQQQTLSDALRDRAGGHRPSEAALAQLEEWAGQQTLDTPQLVVFYPRIWERIAWQAPLAAEQVEQLIDSPLRQEIARRLLDGQSAVWVFLDSGDAERDDAAWELLQAELVRSTQVVQLPARELTETDEFFRPDVEIELRVEFSAVRLTADDPAERAFAALLRGSEADLRDFDEPIALPIYGRGRTYYALVGRGLNADTIEENSHFLCGACSCQVKEDNPGVDMLMAVNWDEHVQGTAMPEVVLPELTGIGALDLAARGAQDAPADPRPPAAADSKSPGQSAEATSGETSAPDAPPASTSPARRETSDVVTAETPRGAEDLPSGSTERFQRRLLIRVAGGALVALVVLSLATFWLRRTL